MSALAAKSAVQTQPLIAVRDVRASSRWYGQLLGADALPEHGHRDVYDRVSYAGRLLLQLHAWDMEDHPGLVNANAAPPPPPAKRLVVNFSDDVLQTESEEHVIGILRRSFDAVVDGAGNKLYYYFGKMVSP